MKKSLQIAVMLLLVCAVLNTAAQGIVVPNAPSPAASVTQTIGISTVSIKYSRPAVNNREIWGKLVPYGWNVQTFGPGASSPWRAGANENTVVTFSHPVKIEGQLVPAGSYGLFFVINQDNSGEVILSKDIKSWGSFFYDAKQDQLKAKIQLRDLPYSVERLTYDFSNLSKTGGELVLNWEKKQFPVKLEFATDEIVIANAEADLKGSLQFTAGGFLSAANYSLQNNINLEQGVKWADQAIAQNTNFPALNVKAGLLRQLGKADEADKLMAQAIPLANEGQLNNYGYALINQGKVDKAIEVFILNTKKFPRSANAWDSLGEAYATKGDKDNAIKSFKKSLTLEPPANVRANSEKFLKQFGAI